MEQNIAHTYQEETIEAKALWFQSLSLEERMDTLVAFTDLILGVNPTIIEKKDAEPVKGRILVLERDR